MFWGTIKEDIRTVYAKDPAARSLLEVLFCYPGLHAVWFHRLAYQLWRHRLYFLARFVSHLARFLTGIEIHPAAKIGRRFFIDHGAGVVIGETCEVGDDVLMYQGSVLGGTSLKKEKRHPTIGDRVVVGTGAVILGPIVVGSDARIGSGSVVIKPVPPGATVVGVPGRVVRNGLSRENQLEHNQLTDPVAEAIRAILTDQDELRERVRKLEESQKAELEGVPVVITRAVPTRPPR